MSKPTEHTAEIVERCDEPMTLIPFGCSAPLRCLLAAPHEGYRHYAVMPDDPMRFWTWTGPTTVTPPEASAR